MITEAEKLLYLADCAEKLLHLADYAEKLLCLADCAEISFFRFPNSLLSEA